MAFRQVPNEQESHSKIGIDWQQGYGFQFWRCQPQGVYRGDGAFGQYCIVMPEQDAVLAITSAVADMQPPLNLVWDLLLPAMKSAALAEDSAGQAALQAKLASLTLPPQPGSVSSPTAAKVSRKTYAADANKLNIETVCFDFAATTCSVSYKIAGRDYTITGGYSSWQPGTTNLFTVTQMIRSEDAPILASGGWTADDTFTMMVRLYETPFFGTISAHFEGSQLTLESFPNVAFVPARTVISAQAL